MENRMVFFINQNKNVVVFSKLTCRVPHIGFEFSLSFFKWIKFKSKLIENSNRCFHFKEIIDILLFIASDCHYYQENFLFTKRWNDQYIFSTIVWRWIYMHFLPQTEISKNILSSSQWKLDVKRKFRCEIDFTEKDDCNLSLAKMKIIHWQKWRISIVLLGVIVPL